MQLNISKSKTLFYKEIHWYNILFFIFHCTLSHYSIIPNIINICISVVTKKFEVKNTAI